MSVRHTVLASVSTVFLAASAAVSGPSAATLNPSAVWVKEAYQSLSSGNPDAAVVAYGRAIESRQLPPEALANALINRGLAYQHLDEHEAAVDDYTAALRLDAMSASLRATTLYNRGLSQQKLNQPALAIEDFTSALFLDSTFAHAYLSRANILRDSGQYLFALSDYEKAVRFHHPDTARVFFGEALTYAALKRPAESRKALDRALAANPAFAPALKHLAGLDGKIPESPPASDPIITASLTGNLAATRPSLPEPVAPAAVFSTGDEMPKVVLASIATKRKLFVDRVPQEDASESPRPLAVAIKATEEEEKIVAIEAVPDEPNADVTPEPTPVETAEASDPPLATGWTVQIASASSEDGAWSTWKKLQNRYKALAKEKPVVVKADLGNKGIYYRVRLTGFDDQDAAKSHCSSLKRKGVSCYISKA